MPGSDDRPIEEWTLLEKLAGYYVKIGRATTGLTLRWQNAMQRQVFPKFWKPLPLPKNPENGGGS